MDVVASPLPGDTPAPRFGPSKKPTAPAALAVWLGLAVPVFIGGRLNQIPDDSNTSLPVEVSAELGQAGARVCADVTDMLGALVAPPADRAA